MLRVKRVYKAKDAEDGIRILVDRLWPRGLSQAKAGIDEWAKDLAPSDELRRWFGHKPEKWLQFKRRYIEELSVPEKVRDLERIAQMADKSNVTLVYAAKHTEHNNARVLEELIFRLVNDLWQP